MRRLACTLVVLGACSAPVDGEPGAEADGPSAPADEGAGPDFGAMEFDAVPSCSFSAPSTVLVGGEFTAVAQISNAGDATGFLPGVEVVAPTGLEMTAASSFGTATRFVRIGTCDDSPLDHPVTHLPFSCAPGNDAWVVQSALSSLPIGAPPADVAMTFQTPADAEVGTVEAIQTTCAYLLGHDATNNPGTDPVIRSAPQSADVTASAYVLTFSGSTPATVSGISWPVSFVATVDVAADTTLPTATLVQKLPAGFDIDRVNIDGPGDQLAPLQPNQVRVLFTDVRGTAGTSEAQVTVHGSFGQFSSPGVPLIAPATGEAITTTATAHFEGVIHDEQGNPVPLEQSEEDASMTVAALLVRERVSNLTRPGQPGRPGDRAHVDIDVEASDFFAFDPVTVVSTVGDGILVDAASVRPSQSTVVGTGPTTVTLPFRKLDGTRPGPRVDRGHYEGVVRTTYDGGGDVLAGDVIDVTEEVTGTLLPSGNDVVDTEAGTGSDGRVPIQSVAFDKSIHRVNGAPVAGNPDVRTGDVVTWRLTATVASGAVGGLVLTDYYPQPLFDAQEHGATPTVGTGALDPIRFGPSNSLPGTVPISVTTTPATAANTMTFTIGAFTSPPSTTVVVDLLIDLTVVDAVVHDGLLMTNVATSDADGTGGTSFAVDATGVYAREPFLTLEQGLSLTPTGAPQPSLSGLDAGDEFTTVIHLVNTGGAIAHDTTVVATRDPAQESPAGGDAVTVTNASGTPVPFSGDLFGAGLVIAEIQPSNLGATDEVFVRYRTRLALSTAASTFQTITGEVTYYAAIDGGTDFAEPDLTASNELTTRVLTLTAELTGPPNAVIAATSQVQYVVTVPEGTTGNVSFGLTLPTELAFSATPLVVASAGVTGNLTPSVTNSGRTLTLALGTVVNADTNNGAADTITVTANVIVLNNAASNRNDLLTTTGSLSWQGASPIVAITPALKILESGLFATITMSPDPADGGDTVTVTVAVKRLLDPVQVNEVVQVMTLPVLLTNPRNTTAVSGQAPTSMVVSGNQVTATWTTLANSAVSTWSFQATVAQSVAIGATAIVSSDLKWTSRPGNPGQISPFNTESTERTGTRTPPFNDYQRTDQGQLQISVFGLTLTRESPAALPVFQVPRYRMLAVVPEGTDNSAEVLLQLPLGLVFVTNQFTAFSSALTCNGGPCQMLPQDAVISADRRTVRWTLGRIENQDTNNTTPETVETTFVLAVSNEAPAAQGAQLIPAVQVKTASAVGPATMVIEPALQHTLTTPTTSFDAGDTVTFTSTLSHAASSASEAWTVKGRVDVPEGLTVQGTPVATGCTPTFGSTNPVVSYDLVSLPQGSTCTLTITARADDDLPPGAALTTNSLITWQSQPGDITAPPSGLAGTRAVPRSGDPAAVGGTLNTYRASASKSLVSDDATIAKVLLDTDQAVTDDPDVAIGEKARWTLTVDVPEGESVDTVVTDTPPAGMRVVAVALDTAGFGGTVETNVTGPVAGASGTAQVFDLGTVTNPPDGNAANDAFRLVVTTEAVFDEDAYATTDHPQAAALSIDGVARDQDTVPSGLILGGLVIRIAADDDTPQGAQTVKLTASVENDGDAPACTPEVVVSFPAAIPPTDPATDLVDNDRDGSTDEPDENWSITVNDVVIPKTATGALCLDPGQTRLWDLVGVVAPGVGDVDLIASARLVTWETLDTAAGVSLDARFDAWDTDDDGLVDEDDDEITTVTLDGAVPDLVVTKVAVDSNGALFEPADSAVWTVRVHNAGDGAATNVTLADVIDVSHQTVSIASISVSQGTVDTSGFPTVTASLGTVPAGAEATLTFTGVIGGFVPANTTIANRAIYAQAFYPGGLSDDPATPSLDATVIRVAATNNPDGDCLDNTEEAAAGTDPNDVDSDEDGLSDCDEIDGTGPLAVWAPTDPSLVDTDADGIQDGTEVGLTLAAPGTDAVTFAPDADPATKTDPNDADTDDDGLLDGTEDANHDGEVLAETDPNDADTDADGIQDGTESGVTVAHADTDTGVFVPDADPTRRTDPLDDDTDDDALADGEEDANFDGQALNTIGGTPGSGSGETDASRRDTDGDGLQDGQEKGRDGVTPPPPSGTNLDRFTPDTDPTSTTDPLDTDTDDGGIPDGSEDVNRNGAVDRTEPCTPGTLACELDPQVGADDATVIDDDDDGLSNDEETGHGTDPQDWDTDDDGLSDGQEVSGSGPLGGSVTSPLVQDTDLDFLTDGQEVGLTAPVMSDDDHPLDATDPALFVADTDGTTTTDPADDDTDDDGLIEGAEDSDHDGAVDAIETDPNLVDTDHDRIQDGTEQGLTAPSGFDTNPSVFRPDAHPASTTDPLDDDTDDDGILDGIEAGSDGLAAVVIGGTGSPGGFESDPNDDDTDDDGILDGIEVGRTDTDTDDGGLLDGLEDLDFNGRVDVGETDPRDGTDDASILDSDGEGIVDADEDFDADGVVDVGETDPFDADTDDDGLTDLEEIEGTVYSVTDPVLIDTDADGLQDGLEQGVVATITIDTNAQVFRPDSDPSTTTDPLDADTDDDGIPDGVEDSDHDGAVDANEPDPDNIDTDGDALQDGTEAGVAVPGADTDTGVWQPDVDPLRRTRMLDADTDDDGLLDGDEDANHDGEHLFTPGGTGTPGTGESNPRSFDTDLDGLSDGLESGVTAPHADTDLLVFVADVDPVSTTNPLDTDTDDGGVLDGAEDFDKDGLVDLGELDPNVGADDVFGLDSDDDMISDGDEDTDHDGVVDPGETDAHDADTDDDGLTDEVEKFALSPYAPTDPTEPDTDGDGVQDGTEQRLDTAMSPDTNLLAFRPDADVNTTTDPLDADSDDDGLLEGDEDPEADGLTTSAETDPQEPDTDGDGLFDGTEAGVDTPHDGTAPGFIPDADPLENTDPLDDDTDDDGLLDGTEDADHDGAVVNTIGRAGTAGSGETDPNRRDTDADGLQDGTEFGLTAPQGDDTDPALFVPDADAFTTDPLDDDTDDGGVPDGIEDLDHDGAIDAGEIDPNNPADDATVLDSDEDGLTDAEEDVDRDGVRDPGETDAFDADSDDDALSDGDEVEALATHPLEADTDGDGVQDGTELGRTVPLSGATNPAVFIPDADPATTTDPLDADHDDDGLTDGEEDLDGNGSRNGGTEADPKRFDTDGDGLSDGLESGVTVAGPDTDPGAFVPDTDPTTTTLPLDADTDDDGITDGNEDANHDGAAIFTLGGAGTSGTGETDPNDPDTDGDLLFDGLEISLTAPQSTGTDLSVFQHDTEPATQTDPLDPDTDDGGILDGLEDVDHDGDVDQGEIDPNFGFDDTLVVDADGDGLPDGIEFLVQTDPNDQDTDDDGLSDFAELIPDRAAGFSRTDPRNPDTDGDNVQDGTEQGLAAGLPDTDAAAFVPDADPDGKTDPLDVDTDDDGLSDGDEDQDLDGAVDAGETDPDAPDTDDDALLDGTEVGLTTGTPDTDDDVFVEDADGGLTVTDPLDDDTDDDGLLDGNEDRDRDGVVTNHLGGTGSPGFGDLDPNSPDTDADGLFDGLEIGLTVPEGTGTIGFLPDTDPFTVTHPLDRDTDDGGIPDGFEDFDHDGAFESGETDPNDFRDDATLVDTDGDGLSDAYEDRDLDGVFEPQFAETDWEDADTDDDGLTDGEEVSGALFGGLATDALAADTDVDLLLDGLEGGRDAPVTPDTDLGVFVPDLDPTTRTHPRDDDTDDDGLLDGSEDADHDGAVGATETSPLDRDTDEDHLTDGVEKGLVLPQGSDTRPAFFRSDLSPLTQTDPLDEDTDSDGLLDGNEDVTHDGRVDHRLGDTGIIGFGETDPNEPDTDGDGILDGTERGLTAQEGTSHVATSFVPDADPATTTSAVDTDTDDGGVPDGDEDADHDGAVDDGELDPNDPLDDLIRVDSDGDLLTNAEEDLDRDDVLDPGETDPFDADTDDDGLIDSDEVRGTGALDGFGPTDPRLLDTDNDGLTDGQEAGLARTDAHVDTDLLVFVEDEDPATTTDPRDDDTDDDCLMDGTEDLDQDGAADPTETDPVNFDTDGDGLGDGLESGASSAEGAGSDASLCHPDADPTTTTDPLDEDSDDDNLLDGEEDRDHDGVRDDDETDPLLLSTDGDCLSDGGEDFNHNGVVDAGESDPLAVDSDDDGLPDCDELRAGLDPNAPNGFHGGGGCNAAGGAGFGWTLLGVLPFLRRRRLAALAAAALIAPVAQAQDSPQIDLQRFHPLPQSRGAFMVRDPFLPDEGVWHAGLNLNYGLRPFVMGEGEQAVGVVDQLFGIELTGSYAFLPWLQAGLGFPAFQATDSADDGHLIADAYGASGKSVGIGDISLHVTFAPDFRDEAGHGLGLSFTPRFVFPTGSRGVLVSSGTFQMGADVAFGGRWEHFLFALDAGYLWHAKSSAYGNLYPDDELVVAAHLGVPIDDGRFVVGAEWYATSVLSGKGPDEVGDQYALVENSPMEALATFLWQPPADPLWVHFGIGTGITRGFGSPDLRMAVTIGFGPALAPRDRDSDGFPDASDTCPDEPEDLDEFQDEEGCPDPDNDGDGVLDVNDGKRGEDGTVERMWPELPFGACMNSREDPDGFEDADGCGDLDNDEDGIPDVSDGHKNSHGRVTPDASHPGFGECMNSAEDHDEFEDGDGCADPDNDGDGVVDAVDGHREADGSVRPHKYVDSIGDCANAPEVINGFEDTDGCADITAAYVEGSAILLRDQIYFGFDNATIDATSLVLMDDLAKLLLARPDIAHIEIAGHTSLEGEPKYNQRLSQQRVDAVKKALVDRGVAADRITANGYGEERPLVEPERNERDRARNRRVEIKILSATP